MQASKRWLRRLAAGISATALVAAATSGLAADSSTSLAGKDGQGNLVAAGAEPIAFTLRDLDGNDVSLDDYKGEKAVLLAFWSFFCGPCREEIPMLDTIGKKLGAKDFEILAINLDGPKLEKAVRKYMDSNSFTFRVLWEEMEGITYKTADAYGVVGTPTLVLIGRNGKVSWAHVGRERADVIEQEVLKAVAASGG